MNSRTDKEQTRFMDEIIQEKKKSLLRMRCVLTFKTNIGGHKNPQSDPR